MTENSRFLRPFKPSGWSLRTVDHLASSDRPEALAIDIASDREAKYLAVLNSFKHCGLFFLYFWQPEIR